MGSVDIHGQHSTGTGDVMSDRSKYVEIAGENAHNFISEALRMLGYDVVGSNVTMEIRNPDVLLTSIVNRLAQEYDCKFVHRPNHWRS